jgi:hypothetical protein
VFLNGTINTIIGRSALNGYFGDGGNALNAIFFALSYAMPDGSGGFWLGDSANNMIR